VFLQESWSIFHENLLVSSPRLLWANRETRENLEEKVDFFLSSSSGDALLLNSNNSKKGMFFFTQSLVSALNSLNSCRNSDVLGEEHSIKEHEKRLKQKIGKLKWNNSIMHLLSYKNLEFVSISTSTDSSTKLMWEKSRDLLSKIISLMIDSVERVSWWTTTLKMKLEWSWITYHALSRFPTPLRVEWIESLQFAMRFQFSRRRRWSVCRWKFKRHYILCTCSVTLWAVEAIKEGCRFLLYNDHVMSQIPVFFSSSRLEWINHHCS
jgi:hypothetical protein